MTYTKQTKINTNKKAQKVLSLAGCKWEEAGDTNKKSSKQIKNGLKSLNFASEKNKELIALLLRNWMRYNAF